LELFDRLVLRGRVLEKRFAQISRLLELIDLRFRTRLETEQKHTGGSDQYVAPAVLPPVFFARSHHFAPTFPGPRFWPVPSVSLFSLLIWTPSNDSTSPLGQCTSTESTFEALPMPRCARFVLCPA